MPPIVKSTASIIIPIPTPPELPTVVLTLAIVIATIVTSAKPAVEVRIETTIRMEPIVRILMRRISSRKSTVRKGKS